MAGYSRLASLMASHPELRLFKQFATLNLKNLLYMQSELTILENELSDISLEDATSRDSTKAALEFCFFDLKDSAGSSNGQQWEKVLEIREKLKNYNDALVRYSQVQGMPRPYARHLQILQQWLDRPEGGNFFLRGYEADIWENEKDVVAFSDAKNEKDSCTRSICSHIVPLYHRFWIRRFNPKRTQIKDWDGLWHYDDSLLLAAAGVASTILSSLLPTSSILILYFVKKPLARLVVIMLFTTFFSLTLAFITKAKRIEVFAVTTA
ncbi:MAG: hypothetical protein Q9190_005132 [Brigantiaea leucoxantha]